MSQTQFSPAPPAADHNRFGVKTIHHKVIDGRSYTTVLHGAGAAYEHLITLMDVAAGPATVAIDTLRILFVDGLHAASPTPMTVGEALRALAASLHKAGGQSFVRSLLETTSVSLHVHGQQVHASASGDFDTVFQGGMDQMFKVLAWVIEVNYLPFLVAASPGGSSPLERFKQRLQDALNPSSDSSTSNPTSGSGSASPAAGTSPPPSSSASGPSTKSSTPTRSSTSKKRRR